MKINGYVILQAEGLNFIGLKGDGNDPRWCKVYADKEEARDYLALILQNIKREQGIGWRTKDNLDPKKKLDFFIQKVTIEWDDQEIKGRGWVIRKND